VLERARESVSTSAISNGTARDKVPGTLTKVLDRVPVFTLTLVLVLSNGSGRETVPSLL
jgi:hypothetical protein